MDLKPTLKDWVESKRSPAPPPPSSTTDVPEPHMFGIPKLGDEILNGKYLVERVIGVGGMGVVMSALHKKLHQRVAIKFLSHAMQTPELADRFIREGQAAVRIKSEHIAPVLDVGVLENGTPYLMMEHLAGADLSEYLIERGALPIEDAIDFVLQACDALAVAHSAGIVHRDLKPSNLFVTQRSDGSPLIKVLDFGISKISAAAGQPDPKSTLTRPGMMLGSPRYMSPEQLRNAAGVDHRADIWAIGVVLHELIAGTPPYDADTFSALCAMIASDPPVRLRDVMPNAPEALEQIILKCVEKNAADRYQNVAELATALAPLASDESRIIASRVNKILGYVPGKTPPGAYVSTKLSAGAPHASSGTPGTPKPADKTMPLTPGHLAAPADPQRISSPMATTPLPTAAALNAIGAPPTSTPPTTNPSGVSALAISNATLPGSSGARIGVIALAAAVVVGVLALSVVIMRRPHNSTTTAAATATAPVEAASQQEPTATPTPTPAPVPVPTTPEPAITAAVAATAATAIAIPQMPQTRPLRPGVLPPRPSSSVAVAAASAAPPATATTQAPSEADMLNRRR